MVGLSTQYSVDLLKKQYAAFTNSKIQIILTKKIIKQKLLNMFELLRYISELNCCPEIYEIYNNPLFYQTIDISTSKWSEKMLSYEAKCTKLYFSGIRLFFQKYNWTFVRRSRRPAKDEINSMLNYGYAILQSQIEKILLSFGFDIYLGFYHALRPGRPSLVFDIIELLRQKIVDSAIIDLIISNSIKKNNFIHNSNSVEIGNIVKKLLIQKIEYKLYKSTFPAILDVIDFCMNIIQIIQ